ncbi:MAG TPA: AbrB family transcriptional regulator [Dermatophilaceae bacterium]|nr:AbrB family transcriptional regulator [Dermatophilaceae bacterium]
MTPVILAGVVSGVLSPVGAPSPVLFGSLLAGVSFGVLGRRERPVRPGVMVAGQAAIGATIGGLVDLPTLGSLGSHWLAVLAVCLATLALSLGIGQGLRLHGVTPVTSAFAFIAGGASGIVATARDLGADDRLVGVVQYLRVVIILAGMPLLTLLVFDPPAGRTTPLGLATAAGVQPDSGGPLVAAAGVPADLALLAVSVGVGLGLARLTRMPAGAVLGPLVVAVALSVTGVLGAAAVPGVAENLGYGVVGLLIGLRFTRESLRQVARIVPTAIVLIVLLIAATAGLGVLLSEWTGVSRLDGYLATTPGGLFAVLATAADTGADVTFVLAVQVARLLVMVSVAPLVAALFRPSVGSPP